MKIDLDDMRYALEATVEDVSPIPGATPPKYWTGKVPTLDDLETITLYYRSPEVTEVDIRWVSKARWPVGGWWYIAAWNDYTGWGCQDGVTARWAPTFDELWTFALDNEDRERWEEQ